MHRKNGTKSPPLEWIIVKDAHPPLIADETATAVAFMRRKKRSAYDKGCGRGRHSNFLLSGGLITCGRCGNNIIGFRNQKRPYYVCGRQPFRRGMGCGPGGYVPQTQVESEVIDGIRGFLGTTFDMSRLLDQVNREIEVLWRRTTGFDATTPKIQQP